MYDLTANQWTSPPITTPYSHFAMTVLDDKLVTAGGATKNETVKKVLVFDAGEWKDYSEMPTARCDATAVGYRSILIVVGGGAKVRDEWIRISTTEVLDTTNRCWYTCNNLPSPRQQLKAVTINNKLYLSGGIDKSGKESLQVFVTTLDVLLTYKLLNWQSAPNTPWCASAPVVLCNKFLVTIGGRQRNRTAEVSIFNPSTGQWEHLTNIPAARSGTAVVKVVDNIIVIGGTSNSNNEYSDKMWISVFE